MGVKWLVYTFSKGLDGAHMNMHNHMTSHVIIHSLFTPLVYEYAFVNAYS